MNLSFQLKNSNFDILVIGGGIHGAAVARLAAENGFSVALVEKGDYAGETSSRSSKMLHGGLRYLEFFDFTQVFEGIKAREEMIATLPELCRAENFLLPTKNVLELAKFKIGLTLYDLFVKNKAHQHRFCGKYPLPGNYRYFQYTDGLTDDARLTLLNIDQAKKSGAICANYLSVEKILANQVTVKDQINGEEFLINAKLIINCAGPWAGELAGNPQSLRFSRGTHILYNVPWKHPSLFLPLAGKARYYFVWPHFSGTLVGTTDDEVSSPSFDPIPTREEILEIDRRLKKDLPGSGLELKNAHYAFTGIRNLPVRQNSGSAAVISRKHLWINKDQQLVLYGGKLTTAHYTAFEGVSLAAKILGRPIPNYNLLKLNDPIRSFNPVQISDQQLPELINLAIKDQAQNIFDIMRRRLFLEYLPDNGFGYLEKIKNHLPKDFNFNVNQYQEEIMQIRRLLA